MKNTYYATINHDDTEFGTVVLDNNDVIIDVNIDTQCALLNSKLIGTLLSDYIGRRVYWDDEQQVGYATWCDRREYGECSICREAVICSSVNFELKAYKSV